MLNINCWNFTKFPFKVRQKLNITYSVHYSFIYEKGKTKHMIWFCRIVRIENIPSWLHCQRQLTHLYQDYYSLRRHNQRLDTAESCGWGSPASQGLQSFSLSEILFQCLGRERGQQGFISGWPHLLTVVSYLGKWRHWQLLKSSQKNNYCINHKS